MMILMIQKQVFIILMTRKLTTTIPPKRGPNPQLNISYNTVKTTTIPENINGNNRQVFTQRGKERNKHS